MQKNGYGKIENGASEMFVDDIVPPIRPIKK